MADRVSTGAIEGVNMLSTIRGKVVTALLLCAVIVSGVAIVAAYFDVVVPYHDHIVYGGGCGILLICFLMMTTFKEEGENHAR